MVVKRKMRDKKKTAERIADSMRFQGIPSFMVREQVNRNYSIPLYAKEEITKMVIDIMNNPWKMR